MTEIDTEYADKSKTPMHFYKHFVSKSLPLVLRNEAKSWDLVKKLNETNGEKEFEEYVNSLFIAKWASFRR